MKYNWSVPSSFSALLSRPVLWSVTGWLSKVSGKCPGELRGDFGPSSLADPVHHSISSPCSLTDKPAASRRWSLEMQGASALDLTMPHLASLPAPAADRHRDAALGL